MRFAERIQNLPIPVLERILDRYHTKPSTYKSRAIIRLISWEMDRRLTAGLGLRP